MLIKGKFTTIMVVFIILFFHGNKLQAQSYFFERVYDETLAQASFVIGDLNTKEAIVIDPKRDIDTYLEIAKINNLKIIKATETHIHADFLSGSRELAAATGAELLLSDEGGTDWQYQFPHTGLKEGSIIFIGQVEISVMHTPGHTPESITFLVRDTKVPVTPQRAITGDFIFVGDVGRPDLLEKAAGQEGSQELGAKQLYASIQKFSKLPDDLEIWAGHGAGSFCGKSLSTIPHSTLREEKQNSKAFQFKNDEKGFVHYILNGQPTPPKYFAMMKHLNKVDRPLLIQVPIHPTLNPTSFQKAIDNKLLIIDTRNKNEIAKAHIPGSLHIENGKSFSTWVGSLIDYQHQIVLITDENHMEDLTRKMMRIGMDNIYGFVISLNKMNVALEKSDLVNIEELKKHLNKKDVQIIDVRTESEYDNGHIKGVENIVLTSLEKNIQKISKDKPVIVHCQSGVRAAMAYSILRRNGIKNLSIYLGGINEWTEQKNELTR
ncbi:MULTISPECIES: MBL fold metallo-hydrolase [Flavobacteriales]|uniref:Hydroxyacylglutathione hydrolase n=5 Tax=Flavobacteriales TaxID=200644 RepID=A0A1H5Z2Y4_9FLAO|nr:MULTISPECIES: MBL fold metallo-hydrolase [Flavobacteriales]KIO54475.1 Zn-dependent hydrolase [Flavobacterium hibernum]SEG30554.1 hydroxyacylglutathione hydrolase [Halpernia humi]STO10771.1 Probable polyketide biosynthesis zinc-dependent hydrolase BaeB [Flavobacterium hibernum]